MNSLANIITKGNGTYSRLQLFQIIRYNRHGRQPHMLFKRSLATNEFIQNDTSTNKNSYKDFDKLEELDDSAIDEIRSNLNKLKLELHQNGVSGVNELLSNDSLNVDISDDSSKINLSKEIEKLNNTSWKPTTEQVEEYKRLKDKPIPVRFDPILQHVINMVMRHGKKQRAERTINRALHLIYCQTRLDPVQVLKDSLEKLAPLMITKTFRTGVAKASMIPAPLNQRQRNRMAWKWIMESANKRNSNELAVRLAEELLSIHKGDSRCFEKKFQIQKTAIANRAYIKLK